MKIICDREKLLTAFQTAATVVPSRSPKPILKNVKFEVDQQAATIMATDLEVGIRVELDGFQVESPGQAILPVAQFGSILRESSDAKLFIEGSERGIVVRGDRSEFKLPSSNPDEFPTVESFQETAYHTVNGGLFRELVRRTIFATDPESSRYALGGVLLDMAADRITAVGTDGRRLAKMEGPAVSVAGHQSGATMTIVPTRSMQLIERALGDLSADVQVAARANDILVKSSRATIYSRLVEGRFPKWRDVIPTRHKAIRIDMPVGPANAALRQASIATDADSRGIDFTFGEGRLVLSGAAADVGEAQVEIPIAYSGETITVTLDHRFVLDFFRVLEPEKTFCIEIENQDAAALFSTDDGYSYVVMPLARERRPKIADPTVKAV